MAQPDKPEQSAAVELLRWAVPGSGQERFWASVARAGRGGGSHQTCVVRGLNDVQIFQLCALNPCVVDQQRRNDVVRCVRGRGQVSEPGASEKFMIVVTNNLGQREVMRVTARATDTLTVVRGQEGTTAIAFNAGDRVSHRLTAGAIDAAFGGAIPSATRQAGKLITSDGTTASYSDTLAGPLTLSYASPVFTLNAAASGQTRYSRYRTAGTTRWGNRGERHR